MTDISIESPTNVYTNLLSSNPLETTTHSDNYSNINNFTNHSLTSTTIVESERERSSSPLRLSTTSLPSGSASHSSGTLQKLIRQESQSIPIPNRAQSFDNIHYHHHNNSYCSSPQSDYCLSPLSPTSDYIRSVSSSPFCGQSGGLSNTNQQTKFMSVGGSIMMAKRAISRAPSPLSSSVPTSGFTRSQSVTVHRSEQYYNLNYS